MSDYHHGVEVIEINDGTRTISTVSTAITEHEIARLDASDLMQFAAEVIGFLSPSSAR